mmetsp:Transcript_34567/g.63565  ORF Transcript_34567/g.63565 Transcript_34567/m.63565 type:complete len:92 (+) Transcript_34567:1179-1454(+)
MELEFWSGEWESKMVVEELSPEKSGRRFVQSKASCLGSRRPRETLADYGLALSSEQEKLESWWAYWWAYLSALALLWDAQREIWKGSELVP